MIGAGNKVSGDRMVQQSRGGRVTMKDIAAALDVSINTVHKALTGKPGVSEEVRTRIVSLADEMGYRRNAAASNLRRRGLKIAVCLPSAAREGRYFYTYLWEGCRRYLDEARDAGIDVEFIEFEIGAYRAALAELVQRTEAGEHLDGLLAFAPSEGEETRLLRRLAETGISLILIDGDRPQTKRLGAVLADYTAAGNLLAEQAANLLRFAKPDARILLLTGDALTDSHAMVARAFHSSLRHRRAGFVIDDLAGAHGKADELRLSLASYFKTVRPDLAVSVFALGSEVLADALVECNLVGEVEALGSDLFPESILALRRGIFTNLVYKDPVGMAYRAISDLGNHVLWRVLPANDVQMGAVELVFKSNLDQVCARASLTLS